MGKSLSLAHLLPKNSTSTTVKELIMFYQLLMLSAATATLREIEN
jgi:hypothetical protein